MNELGHTVRKTVMRLPTLSEMHLPLVVHIPSLKVSDTDAELLL